MHTIEQSRKYYEAHRQSALIYAKNYREIHKIALNERHRIYYKTNKDAITAQQRAYYQAKREHLVNYSRAYYATHKDIPKDEVQKAAKARSGVTFRASHKESITEWRRGYLTTKKGSANALAQGSRRRARKAGVTGASYTTAEMIRARCALWGNRCYICGAPMGAIDHVKPLASGGAHLPCNLRPICRTCNCRKQDKWPYEPIFLEKLWPR
mgnify:FL=1